VPPVVPATPSRSAAPLARVEPKPARPGRSRGIRPVHLDQRRPAAGPAGKPLQQGQIAGRVGGNGDEGRVEGPRVGQPGAGTCAAIRRRLGDRMDDRPVRALDRQDDRSFSALLGTGVRREAAVPRPALDRQVRQPDGKHPSHGRSSTGPEGIREPGTARRPRRAFPAPSDPAGG